MTLPINLATNPKAGTRAPTQDEKEQIQDTLEIATDAELAAAQEAQLAGLTLTRPARDMLLVEGGNRQLKATSNAVTQTADIPAWSTDGGLVPPDEGTWYSLVPRTTYWELMLAIDGVNESTTVTSQDFNADPALADWAGFDVTITYNFASSPGEFTGQKMRLGAAAPYKWYVWDGTQWLEDATSSYVFDIGDLDDDYTIDCENGSNQICTMSANLALNVTGGTEGSCVELGVRYTTGIDLSLDASVQLPSLSNLLFPYAIPSDRSFTMKFKKLGGYWGLVSFVGFYVETH
jgi:hypothetical protein